MRKNYPVCLKKETIGNIFRYSQRTVFKASKKRSKNRMNRKNRARNKKRAEYTEEL